jgi:hypothetical protein
MTEVAQAFRSGLDEVHRELMSVQLALADVPWREGG